MTKHTKAGPFSSKRLGFPLLHKNWGKKIIVGSVTRTKKASAVLEWRRLRHLGRTVDHICNFHEASGSSFCLNSFVRSVDEAQ